MNLMLNEASWEFHIASWQGSRPTWMHAHTSTCFILSNSPELELLPLSSFLPKCKLQVLSILHLLQLYTLDQTREHTTTEAYEKASRNPHILPLILSLTEKTLSQTLISHHIHPSPSGVSHPSRKDFFLCFFTFSQLSKSIKTRKLYFLGTSLNIFNRTS